MKTDVWETYKIHPSNGFLTFSKHYSEFMIWKPFKMQCLNEVTVPKIQNPPLSTFFNIFAHFYVPNTL